MKILALCDSPTLPSGFANVARNLFAHWTRRPEVELDVWGIGFDGWGYKRHPNYTLHPAGNSGEWATPARLDLFLQQLASGGYTHVWLMQDTFMLSQSDFPAVLQRVCRDKGIRSLLYFPVDAPLEKEWTAIIAAVDVAVAYTGYGKREAEEKAKRLDLEVRCEVLPHGVDAVMFQPLPLAERLAVRGSWKPQWVGPDDFLMINVGVNQQRKDAARSLEVLAELRRRGVPAKLLMHMSGIATDGQTSLESVGRQLGLKPLVEWAHHGAYFRGNWRSVLSDAEMIRIYNAADMFLSTTLGEGWGLPITEALACGLPVAVPDHTACGEICRTLHALGMGRRQVCLPVETFGMVQLQDNSRLRHRVDVVQAADVIEEYYHAGQWRERPKLNPDVRQWLDWRRIAGRMLELMKKNFTAENAENTKGNHKEESGHSHDATPKYDYYLEFGGGLGDVFNFMWHRGQYNVLRDLQPGERARVVVMCHNPHAKELFAWHPKRALFDLEDLGYAHGPEANAALRAKHNLPPPFEFNKLPVKDGDVQFFTPPGEMEPLAEFLRLKGSGLGNGNGQYLVLAVTAGESDRNIPDSIVRAATISATDEGFLCVFVGRNYDRHGRVEWLPPEAPGVVNLIDQLSVPGTAQLLRCAAGLVTCHSALNILAWHLNVPQLLLYPTSVYERHIQHKDQWAFGVDRTDTVHGKFSEFTPELLQTFLNVVHFKNVGRQEAASRSATMP